MGGGALSPLFSFLLSSVAVLSLCALCSPSPFFLSLYFFLLCFVLLWLFSSLVSFVPLHVRDILFIVETRIFVFIISLSCLNESFHPFSCDRFSCPSIQCTFTISTR